MTPAPPPADRHDLVCVHGTVTDANANANAMLQIVFSRVGSRTSARPTRSPSAPAKISGAGAVTFEKGAKTTRDKRSVFGLTSRSLALDPLTEAM